ncbi:uncharacterized protein LACBIDRAFT_335446 [Laccaria bicolor S238N-H82]|uniref:Predicted protein n=1 Tax=Laccaria bicolor (strain S238N-H82 / ATCC MYA-4686) TaxID=486041 RepID=B0E2C9_LACBS|nr:uncharacterized protein LACBIDRAFT_335446 [Laccaria bicolor S238N-H82]EDQ99011.1 predicted protein [Laccaria bicolor S238N-H82]|eukprot:XP_001890348.1 predicted protein [Laccaria bicolor S238N-H82]
MLAKFLTPPYVYAAQARSTYLPLRAVECEDPTFSGFGSTAFSEEGAGATEHDQWGVDAPYEGCVWGMPSCNSHILTFTLIHLTSRASALSTQRYPNGLDVYELKTLLLHTDARTRNGGFSAARHQTLLHELGPSNASSCGTAFLVREVRKNVRQKRYTTSEVQFPRVAFQSSDDDGLDLFMFYSKPTPHTPRFSGFEPTFSQKGINYASWYYAIISGRYPYVYSTSNPYAPVGETHKKWRRSFSLVMLASSFAIDVRDVAEGVIPTVAWASLPDLSLLHAMETQSKGHLRRRSLELEAVEIERRRVIVWVLAFIARMPKCNLSASLLTPQSFLLCFPSAKPDSAIRS